MDHFDECGPTRHWRVPYRPPPPHEWNDDDHRNDNSVVVVVVAFLPTLLNDDEVGGDCREYGSTVAVVLYVLILNIV